MTTKCLWFITGFWIKVHPAPKDVIGIIRGVFSYFSVGFKSFKIKGWDGGKQGKYKQCRFPWISVLVHIVICCLRRGWKPGETSGCATSKLFPIKYETIGRSWKMKASECEQDGALGERGRCCTYRIVRLQLCRKATLVSSWLFSQDPGHQGGKKQNRSIAYLHIKLMRFLSWNTWWTWSITV